MRPGINKVHRRLTEISQLRAKVFDAMRESAVVSGVLWDRWARLGERQRRLFELYRRMLNG